MNGTLSPTKSEALPTLVTKPVGPITIDGAALP